MISDPRKFVAKWLELKKISVDERGGLSAADKREYQEIFDTLVLDYYEQIEAFNRATERRIKGSPETHLRKALDEIVSLELVKRRAEIFEKIKFSGTENLTILNQFVNATIGKNNPTVVGVMAHFLWQIKRKLMDKEILYHIMPILYGGQGAGKSKALQHLFRPLTNLTLDLSVTEVTDPRFYFSLNRNFVCILDEMAGAKKTDVDNLKKQISATYNDVRRLGGNIVTKIKQNASFIGSTNRPVNEIIFDTTGARRFYEIKTLDRLDWEAINSIDYMSLYRGIDENRERGYLEEVMDQVVEDQKELIGIDELTAFMQAHRVLPGTKEISANTVYDAYKTWAENNGIKNPINSVWFGRKLKNRGIANITKSLHGKTTRVYMIDEDSVLHSKSHDILGVNVEGRKWN